jgi:hypothetical protein
MTPVSRSNSFSLPNTNANTWMAASSSIYTSWYDKAFTLTADALHNAAWRLTSGRPTVEKIQLGIILGRCLGYFDDWQGYAAGKKELKRKTNQKKSRQKTSDDKRESARALFMAARDANPKELRGSICQRVAQQVGAKPDTVRKYVTGID